MVTRLIEAAPGQAFVNFHREHARMDDSDVLKKLNVPWITREGLVDLAKIPIDSTLRQAVGSNADQFRSACRLLGVMHCLGRTEAGVFLLRRGFRGFSPNPDGRSK